MPTSSRAAFGTLLRRHPTEPFVYPLVSGRGRNVKQHTLWGPVLELPAPGLSDEEVRGREEQARARGVEEGRSQTRAESDQALLAARAGVAKAIREFRAEREAYFVRIEAEAVRLALSIARKILHRESQLDPALLAGVARVAMGKFEAGTAVKLRVNRGRVQAWKEALAGGPDGPPLAGIVADDSIDPDGCVLETQMGLTELTFEAQLKEIEQGFFDLLAQRPGGNP